jgi:hypothetical protein
MKIFKRILKNVGFFMGNLCLVYFLEYVCLSSFSYQIVEKLKDKYPERVKSNDWILINGYVIFSFSYQIGVFLSRSSLSLIKIKRVEIVTILQTINFVFFLLNLIFLFVENLWICFGLMIWVGLMAGCSYVNVMYQILESPLLQANEKELALTITTVGNDLGILLASITSTVLGATIFHQEI